MRMGKIDECLNGNFRLSGEICGIILFRRRWKVILSCFFFLVEDFWILVVVSVDCLFFSVGCFCWIMVIWNFGIVQFDLLINFSYKLINYSKSFRLNFNEIRTQNLFVFKGYYIIHTSAISNFITLYNQKFKIWLSYEFYCW